MFHCEKALELEPNNLSLWLRKGRSLRELKRLEEAIPCCDRMIGSRQGESKDLCAVVFSLGEVRSE